VKTNLMLGLMLGLVLGVGMAFFLDYLDNSINSAAEMEKLVGLPLLAVVPRAGAPNATLSRSRRRQLPQTEVNFDFIAHTDGRSGTAEAYRELRTSILLSNPGHPPRQIMISSAMPGEGKTATTINLGIVLAQLGRRILLVDTDLRKPRLHKAFGLGNGRGVSTYLSGLEEDPLQLVEQTQVPNLDLLTSGPIPPNPSELLNSETFNGLGPKMLAERYDHVIFDSPPVLSVSDPVILASVVDAGILVVRAGRTARQSVRLAAGKFQHESAGSFGVVLNDLDVSEGSDHYRYHYYGRYGDGEDETPGREPRRKTGA